MARLDIETPPSILVGQLPPQPAVTLSKTLDAVARVNFEKDTFHYIQTHRRFSIISNVILAALCTIITLLWIYREWSWMEERALLQRKIYQGMIEGPKGVIDPNSFR